MNLRLMSLLTLTLFTTFIACKKDSSTTQQDPGPELTVHAEDQARISGEMDAVDYDMNVAQEHNPAFSGRLYGINSLCGADVIPDTLSNPRKITISYNGEDCEGLHTRTGSIVISMPAGVRWKDAGAELTVTYQNYKVTRLSDKKSITINGSHLLTNVSGGLLYQLPNLQTITHTIGSSNLSITFDDGSQRNWNVARKRVYSYNNGAPLITISGTHTEGSQTGIADWGTDRFGRTFSTAITQPLLISSACNFRLTSGEVLHTRPGSTAVVTFGLDKNGLATTCPATGSYYFKVVWTGTSGTSQTFIAPY
jgi:hypothetical protein